MKKFSLAAALVTALVAGATAVQAADVQAVPAGAQPTIVAYLAARGVTAGSPNFQRAYEQQAVTAQIQSQIFAASTLGN